MEPRRTLLEELHILLANALRQKDIEMFCGRPHRDTAINKDDILNLKISLHCAKTFEQFLSEVQNDSKHQIVSMFGSIVFCASVSVLPIEIFVVGALYPDAAKICYLL